MKSPVTVVGGVVTLLFLAVALVIGLSVTGEGLSEETKTTVLVSMLALVGSTIPSILALYKAEGAQQSSQQLEHDLKNGLVEDKVKTALADVAHEAENGIVIAPIDKLEKLGEDNG